jgi:hypothetical protein
MTWPTALCQEIEAPYVDSEDRFVVSLVFGVSGKQRGALPQEALRAALNYVYGRSSDADHIWCVYDREANECSLIQEGEVLEGHRPPGVSPPHRNPELHPADEHVRKVVRLRLPGCGKDE